MNKVFVITIYLLLSAPLYANHLCDYPLCGKDYIFGLKVTPWDTEKLRNQSCSRVTDDSADSVLHLLHDVKKIKTKNGKQMYHCWGCTYHMIKGDVDGVYDEDNNSNNIYSLLEIAIIKGRNWYMIAKILDMLEDCQKDRCKNGWGHSRNIVKDALLTPTEYSILKDRKLNTIKDVIFGYVNDKGEIPYKPLHKRVTKLLNEEFWCCEESR